MARSNSSVQKKGEINQIDEEEARWFAVYTGFRKEKRVCDSLQKKGINCYLPLQHYTRIYTRKVKEVSIPLISCYVFVQITKREYISVLDTEYVVQFVRFRKDILAIPNREIEILRRVVGEADVKIEPTTYKHGDQVEIIGGQMTGLRGTLESILGKQKLLITLETIGMDLQLEVNPRYLRKIGSVEPQTA